MVGLAIVRSRWYFRLGNTRLSEHDCCGKSPSAASHEPNNPPESFSIGPPWRRPSPRFSSLSMSSFEWTDWQAGKLPKLEAHSRAKLNVLRSYVTDYICILCADSFGRDSFRITLVDGFAGGGAYDEAEFGSPFVLLEAVAAAEAKINANRQKPLQIDCHYYFVDKNTDALDCLRAQLEASPFKQCIGQTIFLMPGSFESAKRKSF